MSSPNNLDDAMSLVGNLDPASRKELSELIAREQATSELQSQIHKFTSTCWDKCITSAPGNSFSRSESDCLQNCVDRFFDAQSHIIKTLLGDKK